MLRILDIGTSLPMQVKVDKNTEYQPGQIVSLGYEDGKTVLDICHGAHPIGIVDDIRSSKMRGVSWDEKVVVFPSLQPMQDIKVELKHANIIPSSFYSSLNVHLTSPINGVITVPKEVQEERDNKALDKIRFTVRYAYEVPLSEYYDTLRSSGQATVWYLPMTAMTDMFDTTAEYSACANLYSSEEGLFTTTQMFFEQKCIGYVIEPPTNKNPMLSFMYLGTNNG